MVKKPLDSSLEARKLLLKEARLINQFESCKHRLDRYQRYALLMEYVYFNIRPIGHIRTRFNCTQPNMRRICLLKSRKVYFTSYPRFTRTGKTRICLLMSRKVYFTPYPRFTRSGKTRICLLMSRKVYFTPYPRFTRSGKTRICLIMSRNVYFTPYPRFTRSGKTRI